MGDGAAIQLPTSATIRSMAAIRRWRATSRRQHRCDDVSLAGHHALSYGLMPGYNAGPTISTLQTDVVTWRIRTILSI